MDALYEGEISGTEPYRLVYRPQYPGPVPHIAYSADFRQPSLEFSGTKEWGRYYTQEGKYHVDLGRGGSVETVAVAVAWWGAPYTDFTMVTDIKLNAIGEQAGFAIGFRGQPRPTGEVLADDQSDLQSAYLLLASTNDLRMTLLRLVDNKTDILVPWTQVRSMRTSNGTITWSSGQPDRSTSSTSTVRRS